MVEGTQSIDRAFSIIDVVANGDAKGVSFGEIENHTGLARATARRISLLLVRRGLLIRDLNTRNYHLGPRIYELGLMVLPSYEFRDIYQPAIEKLVKVTGDTAFLNRIVGDDLMCLSRESGSFPVKTFVLDVGVKRPIGAGAGSIAILASMDPEQARTLLTRNIDRLSEAGHSLENINHYIDKAIKLGYVIRKTQQLGICTVAMAIHDSTGMPFASLSVSSILGRMKNEHLELSIEALEEGVKTIVSALAHSRPMHITS